MHAQMKWLAYPLFAVFAVMTLVAATRVVVPAPECQAAYERTQWGVTVYCPTTPCDDGYECNQNTSDQNADAAAPPPVLNWCACGINGTITSKCTAVWVENEDGTLLLAICLKTDCANDCVKNPPPAAVGDRAFVCKCP